MEDPRLEGSEPGEESEGRIDRSLDEATFDPEESVERRGDYELSEAIQAGLSELVDAGDLFTGDSVEMQHDPASEQSVDHLPVERVSKIDSFTWKLQVAKDEVGGFRIPGLHGAPIVDVPDSGTPNPTGEPIESIEGSGGLAQGGEAEEDLPRDVTELVQLVMSAAAEDMEQDVEDYQAEQEAMAEAKQKIRDRMGSLFSVERIEAPQPGVAQVEDSTEPRARYGEAESEPQVRAETGSAQEDETPPEPDQESSAEQERG